MEEIKLETKQPEQEEQEEEPKSITQSLEELEKFKKEVEMGNLKIKKLRLPRKAKVRKRKLKKGLLGCITIHENRSTKGEKIKVEGGAFRTKDGSYHATDGREVIFWEGKFPLIFQPTWRKNPVNFINPENETYGQKAIMARMIGDALPQKKGGNFTGIIWIIGIAVVAYVAYSLITKGSL